MFSVKLENQAVTPRTVYLSRFMNQSLGEKLGRSGSKVFLRSYISYFDLRENNRLAGNDGLQHRQFVEERNIQ